MSRSGCAGSVRSKLGRIATLGLSFAVGATSALGVEERRLAAAQELERSGQLDPARQLYREIVAAPLDPAAVPEALLALARLAWPADRADQLGRAPVVAGAIEQAAADLTQLRTHHPAAPQTAEALWRLALIELEPASPRYDPPDALASLTTLVMTHPASPRVPEALALAATTASRLGDPARAAADAFALLSRDPARAPECADAWRTLGMLDGRQGRFDAALVEFGRAASCAGAAHGAAANRSRDLALSAQRILLRAAGQSPPLETESSPPLGVREVVLAGAADGTIWIAASKEGVLLAQRGQQTVERAPLPGLVTVALDPWGRRWTVVGERIFAPSGAGEFPLPERFEPIALAPVEARSVWVVDGRAPQLVRLSVGGRIELRAALPARSEPRQIVAAADGGVWVLDERSPGALHRIAPDGALVRSIPLANLGERFVDLALDPWDAPHLLDAKRLAVTVLAPDGKVQQVLPLPQNGPGAIGRAAALWVEASGAVVIFDGKSGRLTWLR